jgi:peptidoglycan/xylan/chitin deacetylase (PgdA/CDA1 family)
MNEGKRVLKMLVLIGVMLIAAACGPAQAEPTPATMETAPPPPTATAEVVPQQTVLSSAAGTDSTTGESTGVPSSVAGRFRLKPPGYEEDYEQAIEEDYYLVLNEDGTAQFEAEALTSGEVTVEARGTWRLDGDGAIIEITELFGEPVTTPEVLRYEYHDGFPVATEYAAGDTLYNLEEAEFTIGAGERHPLVHELHRRLASIDYLGFTDPGDDLYTETTRKAVVAFQEAQGLLPNGEVDPSTWVLLGSPPPPLPTPTPLPAPTGPTGALGVPDLKNLPTHTDEGKPILYFTFDDGPSKYSQQIIDLLAQYDAQATFFVLGKSAKANPDLIRAMAEGGHYVANHTFGHPSLKGVSREDFVKEVEGTKEIILDIALDLFGLDRDVRYLRPPYGATDANTRQNAADLGYAVVLWDVDPQDWRRPGAKVIAGHIVRSAYPGAIILMHDGGGERTQSVAALETALRELSAQGYVFRNIFVP